MQGDWMAKKKIGKKVWRTSEKIVLGILIDCMMIIKSAVVYAFINKDGSVWAYIIPAVGAMAASAFAVFVWKEKNENVIKILNNPDYDREKLIEQVKQEVEEEFQRLGR